MFDGKATTVLDLRPSSPCLARSKAPGFGGGATLRRQVQPYQPASYTVVPANIGFLIFDPQFGGYGIAQLQAREKSLLGLPVLATAALAGVVSFLEALSWP